MAPWQELPRARAGTGMQVEDGLTLDELAQAAGMTPRNVRAHQSRGLLPPPRVRGRTAYYDSHHVARLALVRSLQEQGFNLEAIRRVIGSVRAYATIVAFERDHVQGDTRLTGVEHIENVLPGAIEEFVRLGLLRRDDDAYFISLPLAGMAGTLVQRGVPAELVLALQIDAGRAGFDLGRRARELLAMAGAADATTDDPPESDRPENDPQESDPLEVDPVENVPQEIDLRGDDPAEDDPAADDPAADDLPGDPASTSTSGVPAGADLLRVAAQLYSTGFEVAFAHAAGFDDDPVDAAEMAEPAAGDGPVER